MSTPKQKHEQHESEAQFPPVLKSDFDQCSEADAEFTRWRFPERDE